MRRGAGTLALGGALVLGGARPALAATYRIHSSAGLQTAVAAANASGSASTIELGPGVYLPTATLNVGADITIVGPSAGAGAELSGSSVEPSPASLLNVEAHGMLSLVNLELTASGGAGAAAVDDFGAVELDDSTVAGNAGTGVLVQSGATAKATNSTLSDGLAFGVVDDGGASFVNSTVASNKDGGIETKGTLSLTNTIVADNRGAGDCRGRATTSDRSLDSDGSCGVGALSDANPRLATLAENGGPTLTQALGTGSLAIGAADQSRCPVDDQRHFARPVGHCDIGAYQTGARSSGGSSPGGGAGAGGSGGSSGTGRVLPIGVNGHGTLRATKHARATFSVHAEVGHSRTSFRYSDPSRQVQLTTLTLKSMSIDERNGVVTLRGRGIELRRKGPVNVTLVLVSHGRHRSVRIRLSNGYYANGPLLKGSITFVSHATR